jgi:hypothetical protein
MMGMPRFSIKSLLVAIAVSALWLSTFVGYSSASNVRAFIMLGILVASGVAAISYVGRRRAFWAGFFITVLTAGIDGKPDIGRGWITSLLNSYGIYQNLPNGFLDNRFMFLNATTQAVAVLLIATVMGVIGILVQKHCERSEN